MKNNRSKFISILSSITLISSLLVIGSTSTPEASATEDLPVALQLGESFVGEASNEGLGWSVDSSDDGSIVAMGGQTHGTSGQEKISFKVFEYATLDQKWLSYGSAIEIPVSSDDDVSYLSLSSDGNVMAVGVPSFESGGDRTGLARVYEFTDGIWEQKGQDITGAAGSRTGGSVAIDSSGNRMAVAIPNPTSSQALVRIYDYQAGSWVLEEEITFDINQTVLDSNNDPVALVSNLMNLSISNDGKTIAVAGGNLGNGGSGYQSNQIVATVQVYQQDNDGDPFVQLGDDFNLPRWIYLSFDSNSFISLSGDGNRLAIGDNYQNQADVYELTQTNEDPAGSWTRVGQQLPLDQNISQNLNAFFGTSVSLNSDGSKLAVATLNNDPTMEGFVEIYELGTSGGSASWTKANKSINRGDYSSDAFGYGLALSDDGDRLIVGDPSYTIVALGIARVYSSLGIDPEGRSDPASNVLIATMYERHASFDIVKTGGGDIGTFSGDEYFYRIAKGSENNVVDMQSTAGLEQLSYGEQEDYYNIGWFFSEEDPYEFLWYVALCEDEDDGTLSQPLNVQTGFQQPLLLPTEELNGDSLVQFWEVANSSDVTPLQTIQTLKKEGSAQTTQPDVDDGETAFPSVKRNGEAFEYEMRSSETYLQYDCLPGAYQIPLLIRDQDGNAITSRELDLEDDHYIDTGVSIEQIDLEGMYVVVYGYGGEGDSIAGTVAHLGVTKAQSTSYNISYHPNGASNGSLPDDQSVAAGDFTPPGNTGSLERPGFEFIGWSDDFTENIAEYPLSINTNTRLYAIWEELPGNDQSDNSDPNEPSSGFSPGPYSGPIITTVGFGPETTYSSLSNTPVIVSGQRLSGITKATVGNRDATVVNSTSDSFTMLIPEGLAPGTYDLKIETPLGDLNYLAAITIADVSYGEVSAWTKRISDTQAKVYVKFPTVGEKVRISHQTGGSGSYESVYVKTTSSETMEGLRVVEGVGTYIVRTINLSEINRIRVTVGDQEMVQVRYNN